MMMKDVCNVVQELKPVLLMIVVQIASAGVNVFYKLAVNDGMSLRVLVAYRFLFATAIIAPLALILERNKRTKMTCMVLFQSFLCGLFGGSLTQNFYLQALALTSATFASAIANLIPGLTFILAVCFGLEKLNWKTVAGKVKIVGTLIGIGGAMILTFVKGKDIELGSFHLNLLHSRNGNATHKHVTSASNTLLGSLFALVSATCYALWLIVQAKMSKRYPSLYSSTALMSFWSSVVSVVFALCLERDWTQWRLGWNIRLYTAAYSGMVVSGMMVVVISWCINIRGPLFASVFSPLMLVIVALAGTTMLNEKLHLGCIIGAVLIVSGLYLVLWGKSEEMKKNNQLVPSQSPHDNDSNTVEILVRSAQEHQTNPNKTHEIAPIVVKDYDDSSSDGHQQCFSHQHKHGTNRGEEENTINNASHV